MKLWIAALAVLAAVSMAAAPAAQTASMALLQRAAGQNPTLKSYTASAQLTATLHVLVPVHKAFSGTVYYLRPNRKVEFDNVTGALSRFKDLATTTPSYADAIKQYTITPLVDDGTESTYSAVPKATDSRVKSVTLTVNDRTALVDKVVWAYTNGGSLTFDQTYAPVGIFTLPAKSDIAARFPGYSVDGTLTFSNYAPNAVVSPSVFAK